LINEREKIDYEIASDVENNIEDFRKVAFNVEENVCERCLRKTFSVSIKNATQ